MRHFQKESFLYFTSFILLVISVTCAYSCAPIEGYLMDEATVIIWDKQTQTEHFIRRATFEDIKGNSVGFIVPTPNVPQLAEANEDILFDLDRIMEPKTETRESLDISLGSWIFPSWKISLFSEPEPEVAAAMPAPDAAMPAVEMLQHQRIGDLDAMTVRATDAKALNRWLAKHEYSSSPEFEKWLDIYVQKGWVITAFKFVPPKESTALSSPMIRMSFKTDHPFYPYREPQNEETIGGRQLRIYLFSSGRMQAAPGHFGKEQNWPGEVEWSDDLQKHSAHLKKVAPSLAKQLGLSEADLKQAHWMTVFDDYSESREGADDITFIPATDKSTLPPPYIEYKRTETKIPVEAILLLVAIVGAFIKTWRGRGGSSEVA